MKYHLPTAETYIPDELPEEKALARTTHMGISAHQDDLEIMAAAGILECFQQNDKWFTGVVVTNGRGSPRDDLYKDYTDDQMHAVRFKEQRKAAMLGEYAAQILLDFPSSTVKDGKDKTCVADLIRIFKACQPDVIYTHNLADKHDTHVGVALKTIAALRQLAPSEQPRQVIGCEVWRNLDWLVDAEKIVMDVSGHPNMQAALLGVFDSQICGGKRYDLAALGRRSANATFFASHHTDASTGLVFGMDLTPLIKNPELDIQGYTRGYIDRFAEEVQKRIQMMLP
jgi:LmbE family N-acetylglucosaminyl deacetylase